MQQVNIFWFRRDLRLDDNAGLYHALKSNKPVLPIFIFDTNILDELEDKADRRVEFIHAALEEIQEQLIKLGSSLEVYHGKPLEVYKELLKKYKIGTVFTNHDYEPYALEREKLISDLLKERGTTLKTFKDQVILEKDEVLKDDGKPYTVFTPYSRKWKAVLTGFHLKPYPTKKYFSNFFQQKANTIPSLKAIGFKAVDKPFPSRQLNEELIKKYGQQRDFPGINGTSKLGVHLRFGTISIRQLAEAGKYLSETYLNELIWRDFYHSILWHFPQVGKSRAFKPEYDHIEWRTDNGEFEKWCMGRSA